MRFDSETVFSGSLEGVLRSLLVLRLHAAAFEEREQDVKPELNLRRRHLKIVKNPIVPKYGGRRRHCDRGPPSSRASTGSTKISIHGGYLTLDLWYPQELTEPRKRGIALRHAAFLGKGIEESALVDKFTDKAHALEEFLYRGWTVVVLAVLSSSTAQMECEQISKPTSKAYLFCPDAQSSSFQVVSLDIFNFSFSLFCVSFTFFVLVLSSPI
ncbi:hypothetical protein RUM43_001212 [Polyplax serrata]|uniref:Uncharacterized protein n=1 Tax=Polyplax serrata TaxID=468196 RepID=A0AAN8XRQ3_POLSC